MGIDYNARLIWGIKFERPHDDGSDDDYDEKWDDVGYKWEKAHQEETGVSVVNVRYLYDGSGEDEEGNFMFPTELGFKSDDYSCNEIDIPTFDKAEMQEKLKAACKILGIEYQEPRWYLMSEGS